MTPSFDDVKRGRNFWAILLYVILGYFVFLHVLVFDLVDMYNEPLLYMDMCFYYGSYVLWHM